MVFRRKFENIPGGGRRAFAHFSRTVFVRQLPRERRCGRSLQQDEQQQQRQRQQRTRDRRGVEGDRRAGARASCRRDRRRGAARHFQDVTRRLRPRFSVRPGWTRKRAPVQVPPPRAAVSRRPHRDRGACVFVTLHEKRSHIV